MSLKFKVQGLKLLRDRRNLKPSVLSEEFKV